MHEMPGEVSHLLPVVGANMRWFVGGGIRQRAGKWVGVGVDECVGMGAGERVSVFVCVCALSECGCWFGYGCG